MKKIYRLLYSNKFVAMVMLLMQIITFVAMYIWISDYSKVLFGLSTVLSAVLIIFEINRTEESTFKMTWITLIAIIPIFGALFYLFTRAQGVSMNIGDDYKTIQEANKKYLVQEEDVMKKKWDELTNDDWNRILTCGYHTESWQKRDVEDDKSFSSLSFMNLPLTKEQILNAATQILGDPSCGHEKGAFESGEIHIFGILYYKSHEPYVE